MSSIINIKNVDDLRNFNGCRIDSFCYVDNSLELIISHLTLDNPVLIKIGIGMISKILIDDTSNERCYGYVPVFAITTKNINNEEVNKDANS